MKNFIFRFQGNGTCDYLSVESTLKNVVVFIFNHLVSVRGCRLIQSSAMMDVIVGEVSLTGEKKRGVGVYEM